MIIQRGETTPEPQRWQRSLGTATMTRRQVGQLFGAAAALGLPTSGAAAAHASDSATPVPVGERLSDYPELNMTSTDTELRLPGEISAGRYLVTIDNQSTQGESAPVVVLLDDGQTVDEFLAPPKGATE